MTGNLEISKGDTKLKPCEILIKLYICLKETLYKHNLWSIYLLLTDSRSSNYI